MKKTSIALITLFTLLILTSCGITTEQPSNDMPDMGVKAQNWNSSITLVDDPILSNSYKNGDVLELSVENLSDTQVVFPDDFGIKIITWDGQRWTSIPNNFYYTFPKVLPTKDSYPLGLIVDALPYVVNLSAPITIRIVIIGHAEGNEEESLGAYLDVPLKP